MDNKGKVVSEDRADHAGRAYGRPPASYDKALVEVSAGTPGGELLRRYWQPFALSSEVNNDLPLPIRILGEDLVAFRDGEGKVGLMYPRCMHRGADLVYGKLEAKGIRCPYHGWMYDTQGHLLDTPCELDPTKTGLRKVIRQPWYPVTEKHGLAFTYMGPPEKEPLFPRIPLFDNAAGDEEVVAGGGSKPPTGPLALAFGPGDYNWLQYFENFMDPLHLAALHTTINGNQFNDDITYNPDPCRFKTFDKGSVSWIGHWNSKKTGVFTQAIFQTIVPNIHVEGPVFAAGHPTVHWVVPCDDTNFRFFMLDIRKKGAAAPALSQAMFQPNWGPGGNKEAYSGWTFEDKQRWQTDYLVQRHLGRINLQSDEHLTTADAGISMLRRVLKQQAALVVEGKDPIGAQPGEADVFEIYASTARLDPKTGSVIDGYMLKALSDY